MRTVIGKTLALLLGLVILAPPATWAAEVDTQVIQRELQILRDKVQELEAALAKTQAAAQEASQSAAEARETSAHSLKISQEVAQPKDDAVGGIISEAGKRLKIYGAVEVEASYQSNSPKEGQSSESSDLSLATAELFVEAGINDYVNGLIHFLYEQDDADQGVKVDEAFILLGQTEDMPAYFMGGLVYPAIGLFETYLVSDPVTQNVFETQATAAEAGWAQDWFNAGVGIYKSSISEADEAPDSHLNSFYARLQVEAPEGALGEDVEFKAGAAFTNNIAGGNLGDEVTDETVKSLVGGWSVMAAARYQMVALTAEYIAALDDFEAGELGFMGDAKGRPQAFNVELALMPWEAWTFALRYGGGSDLGDLEPEQLYAAGVSWEFLPNTTLGVEYAHGEFENDDEVDWVVTQLAVEF